MKKYIFLVIVALCIVAFASNMSYKQQTIVPELRVLLADKPFEETLSLLKIPYWGTIISVESRGYFYFVEFLVRKATHFIGFGIVGTILYLFYRKLAWHFPSLLAIATIFVIASLDELRQSFLPGRTGVFSDVLLDSFGAVVFIMVTAMMTRKKRAT
ncbi:VanZ family protein [Metasolibacillus sp.]|uniref:VanZ family protein n=1 Tax=Metasolibacillus sp. TaxID=2703680 RepID=UPI0025D9E65D|nr:VanZ family protein [Metasolibacillus sp.]MCT6923668.1 VanZ family protein [Metasolibacillus sp.]MCT6939609.1 VanZ family protein [Metasolibacillus sp.]